MIKLPVFPKDWSIRRSARAVKELRSGTKAVEEVAAEAGLPPEVVAEWIPRLRVLDNIVIEPWRRRQDAED